MIFLDKLIAVVKLAYYGLLGLLGEIKYRNFGKRISSSAEEENVEGQVVLITGASRGIGKETATELAKRGAIVVLGCVEMEEGEEAANEIKSKTGNNNIDLMFLDLSDMDLVEKFAIEVARKYPKIKILVNNAGVGFAYGDWAKKKTREGFNLHVAVNHLGHFLLTNLLLDNLRKAGAARVVAMSSTMQLFSKLDLDDIMMDKPFFSETIPYNNTKLQNALFIKELGKRMKDTGISTYGLCPGIVRTAIWDCVPSTAGFVSLWSTLSKKYFGFTPKEAAEQFVMYCALNKTIANETGLMYRYKQHFDSANVRLHPEMCNKLWNISSDLVKLEERLRRFQEKVHS